MKAREQVYLGVFMWLILTAFFSCGNQESQSETQKITKQEQDSIRQESIERQRQKTIDELVDRYNISFKFEYLAYEYSYEYDTLIDTEFQLIENIAPYSIQDIFKENDSNRLILGYRAKVGNDYVFDLNSGDLMTDKILDYLNNDELNDTHTLNLVVSIKSIRKFVLELNTFPEYDDECYLEVDFSHYSTKFLAVGKVVEVVLIQK